MPRKELPYPPSPKNVPEDLTLASPKFMYQATLLLLTLFLFVLVYLGFMVLCGFGIYWGLTAKVFWPLQIGVIILAILFLLFLCKGFFSRGRYSMSGFVEVTEDDQPELYDFVERLCEEVKAPFPQGIYVFAEVNAAMSMRVSLMNLFASPRKNLILGLGLVNFLNLSELKAVIAHELGHSAQKSFIDSYTLLVRNVIVSLFFGSDWLDDLLERNRRRNDVAGLVAKVFYSMIFVGKKFLAGVYYLISLLEQGISRQREFNADLVAVSVAGSDAIVHGLKRTEFAHEALMQAFRDLEDAADHKFYTDDLFLHQTAAAAYIRRKKKDPKLGNPPELKGPSDGKNVQVFNSEEYGEAPMWSDHPSLYDREENAKSVFIPAVIDDRPAWILFEHADELKEMVAYKFYRQVYKVPKDVDLANAKKVQKFIDDEHAEMEYDPRYHGAYDGRYLNPGSLEELDEIIEKEPWEDERLSRVEAKLYKGLERRVEDRDDAIKEYNRVLRDCDYRPRGKTKRIVEDLDEEIKEHADWFKSFDRRVYLVYMQMARRISDAAKLKELRERYRFHLPLQDLYKRADEHRDKLEFYFAGLFRRPPEQITQDFVSEAFHAFRQARKTLKGILRDARDMDMPMLKNFAGDERLDEFLLDETLIKELPETYVDTKWLDKMWRQLSQVLKKSCRLYFKSVGNILAMQEQIAKEFNAMQPPPAIPDEGEDIPEAIIDDATSEGQEKKSP
jgi:Zn-dependent protease with chaperone function